MLKVLNNKIKVILGNSHSSQSSRIKVDPTGKCRNPNKITQWVQVEE